MGTMISRVQLVMIPSTDQDRSIAFYTALGFEKRSDFPWHDGHRWIEIYPPDSTTGLTLVPPRPGDPARLTTGVILNTGDIDATHAELLAAGVDVDPEIAREGGSATIRLGAVEMTDPTPPMFWLRDPDGNSLLVVEPK